MNINKQGGNENEIHTCDIVFNLWFIFAINN